MCSVEVRETCKCRASEIPERDNSQTCFGINRTDTWQVCLFLEVRPVFSDAKIPLEKSKLPRAIHVTL
jgi:hypothetical protein